MILITGGCGYLGSHCAVKLIKSGFEVVILDNLRNSDASTIDKIKSITKKNCEFVESDIRDQKNLKKVFEKYNFDIVFHFAGLKSINESLKFSDEYFSCNVSGAETLINQMKTSSVNKIIFSSSATVYGENFKPPWSETLKNLNPNNVYAQTKLMVEKLLYSLTLERKDFKVGILRYFNPIGNHESGLLGDRLDRSTNLVPAIINTILGKQSFVEVFGNDYQTNDGTGVRDYIHVNDLIDGHLKAYDFIEKNGGYNIWNLGMGRGYSVLELINCFESYLDSKIPIKFKRRREGDLDQYWADVSKAKKELGWIAKKNLNDMTSDTLTYVSRLKEEC
tara:strand:- start:4658 stop:5662 length:1005 start_codon:yes stop_codon:yes gene_type:complete